MEPTRDTTRGPMPFLAVVRRSALNTFTTLAEHFDEQDHIQVVWDRRSGERRLDRRPVTVERRQQERRHPPPTSWTALNFVFVPQHPGDV